MVISALAGVLALPVWVAAREDDDRGSGLYAKAGEIYGTFGQFLFIWVLLALAMSLIAWVNRVIDNP